MKTIPALYKYVLVLVLMVSAQQLQAQEAFYIYRNDGNFDGFFFDQIERMGYSKYDLDSVEHDIYVVQEIETADSLYRIPLAVIDSIGFQQPEIIFNPNLKNMDETGIAAYIASIRTDDRAVMLRRDIPQALMPQAGDVLVGFDEDTYEPFGMNSFAGKVRSVENDPDAPFIYVYCDPVTDLGDIFVQFIAAEQVAADNEGQVRRRLAGYHPDGMRRAKTGEADFLLINENTTLKKQFKPFENTQLNLNLGVGLQVRLQMAYNISWRRAFVKTMLNTGIDLTPSIGMKASGSFEFPIDGLPQLLKSIKFPAVAPLFQTRPLPEAFLRGGGDLEATVTFPTSHFGWDQTIVLDTDLPGFPVSYSSVTYGPDEKSSDGQSFLDLNSASISLTGYVQTGIKNYINIESNDWAKDFLDFGIGIELYTGPKIEGGIKFETNFGNDGEENIYDNLMNSYIKPTICSVDLEAKARYKLLWGDEHEETLGSDNLSFGDVMLYLFPQFKPTEVDYNNQHRELSITLHPYSKTFWRNYFGVAYYDDEDELVDKYDFTMGYQFIDSLDYQHVFSTKGLPCGWYFVQPYIKTLGQEIPVRGISDSFYITPFIEVDEDSLSVDSKGQSIDVLFGTNAEQVKIDLYDENPSATSEAFRYTKWMGEDSWATAKVVELEPEDEYGKMTISISPNKSIFPRSCMVVVSTSGDDSWSETFVSRDTLYIRQAPGSDKITSAEVWFVMPASTTAHSWGTKDGVPYDNTDTWEVNIGCGKTFQSGDNVTFTSTRSGNIINIKYEDRSVGERGEVSETIEMALDVSRRPGRILSGSYSQIWDFASSESGTTYGTDSDNWSRFSWSSSETEKLNEKWGWNHVLTGYEEGGYLLYSDDLTTDVWGSSSHSQYSRSSYTRVYKDGTTDSGSDNMNATSETTPKTAVSTGISVKIYAAEE